MIYLVQERGIHNNYINKGSRVAKPSKLKLLYTQKSVQIPYTYFNSFQCQQKTYMFLANTQTKHLSTALYNRYLRASPISAGCPLDVKVNSVLPPSMKGIFPCAKELKETS